MEQEVLGRAWAPTPPHPCATAAGRHVSPECRWGLKGEFKETGGGDKAQGQVLGCSLGWPAQGTPLPTRGRPEEGVFPTLDLNAETHRQKPVPTDPSRSQHPPQGGNQP